VANDRLRVLLGSVVTNLDSKRVPVSVMERRKRQGPYPYYGATGVMDHVDDFLFEGLHLLIAEDGSVETRDGRPVLQLVDGKFWVNNHAHVLRGATDDDTRYLYYALQAVQIRPFMSGSVQAKLSQGNLNRIEVPYPNEGVRKGIAAVLGLIDAKIASNRAVIAQCDDLLTRWYLSTLDEGSATVRLGSVITVTKGVSYKSDELRDGGGVLLSLKCFSRDGSFAEDGLKPYIGPAKDGQHLDAGDIVVAQTDITQDGSVVGRALRVPAGLEAAPVVASLDALVVRSIDKRYPASFLAAALRSDAFRQHCRAHSSGTTVLHMRSGSVEAFALPVPLVDVVQQIDALAAPTFELLDGLRAEIRRLTVLREDLLPDLLDGTRKAPVAA